MRRIGHASTRRRINASSTASITMSLPNTVKAATSNHQLHRDAQPAARRAIGVGASARAKAIGNRYRETHDLMVAAKRKRL